MRVPDPKWKHCNQTHECELDFTVSPTRLLVRYPRRGPSGGVLGFDAATLLAEIGEHLPKPAADSTSAIGESPAVCAMRKWIEKRYPDIDDDTASPTQRAMDDAKNRARRLKRDRGLARLADVVREHASELSREYAARGQDIRALEKEKLALAEELSRHANQLRAEIERLQAEQQRILKSEADSIEELRAALRRIVESVKKDGTYGAYLHDYMPETSAAIEAARPFAFPEGPPT